ncbi:MAG: type IX secretion system outer membrane channel protein PorV [Bacteroidales bacterium]|nr:type IX secretion system outer membrane channel protein PorV [Bacteroidales bacterium]
MKQIRIILACTLTLWLAVPTTLEAQNGRTTGQNKNFVSTGMPILLISPDAVSSALGDAGVASLPDIYSAHWNNAKFAFVDGNLGFSTTYTPWLRNLNVGDMNLLYLGGYYRINKRSTAAASLTYFSLGEIQSTDVTGQPIGVMSPNEFAFDLTYAMKLNDELSIGASGRFIQSDLTNGQILSDGSSYVTTKPARSIAADLGLYWQHPIDREQDIALGAFISNMGAKLSYTNDDTRKEFLPTNLRVGGRYTTQLDAYNELSVLVDFNKLLVPTPPISDTSLNRYYKDKTEWYQTGVMRGAIQSFYDAPGGLTEELQEIQISAGAEYWYKQTLAARMGYFYESYAKGGRQYATFGFALRYQIMQFDLSYIVPTTNFSSNPLTNTIRISLTINLKHTKNSPIES